SGPQPELRFSPSVLDYSVTRPDVVKQEVAVGVNYLIAQRRRHGERPAIDYGARRRRRNGRHVANCAADRAEYLLAGPGVGRRRKLLVAADDLGTSHKFRESIYVPKLRRSPLYLLVLRVGDRVAQTGYFGRIESISYAHLVQIGIPRKR